MKGLRLIFMILVIQVSFLLNASAQRQFRALVVTTTKGWHHESVHAGFLALKEMGVKNFFDVVLMENPNGFDDKVLEQFQVVIFLNTTGDIFNEQQQKSMEKFIQSGKGFVGVHSASDTEYDWP
ncbi:MAG: ThuA domain-containing protein, partial [Chitinophagaceae bacterium]